MCPSSSWKFASSVVWFRPLGMARRFMSVVDFKVQFLFTTLTNGCLFLPSKRTSADICRASKPGGSRIASRAPFVARTPSDLRLHESNGVPLGLEIFRARRFRRPPNPIRFSEEQRGDLD